MLSLSVVWLLVATHAFCYVSSQFAAFQDRHINGGVLQQDSRSFITCRLKCKRTAGCAALDFDFAGRTCWFHTLQAACQTPAMFMRNARHVKMVNCNRNTHGSGGKRQFGIRDAETCVSRCQEDCFAADFDETDKSCWFHTRATSCKPLRAKARCTHYRKEPCDEDSPLTPSTPVPPVTPAPTPAPVPAAPPARVPAPVLANSPSGSSDTANSGGSSSSSEDEVPFEAAPPNVIAKIGNRVENRHVIGGNLINGLRDWVSCVSACLGTCRAVDFDRNDRSCWHHTGARACVAPVSFRQSCTHYKMTACARELTGGFSNQVSPAFAPAPRIVPQPQPIARNSFIGCGDSFYRPNGGRIIGGDESRPHSWPWQVALRNRNARSSRCAGTFIANSWILTTAHCVDQDLTPENWLVLSGAHDLLQVEPDRIAHTVSRIILHEQFDLNTFDNDIALMKLSQPAQWSAIRRPICLPPAGYQFPGGTSCYITGWGVAANGRRPLKQADIPTVPDNICRRPDWLGSEFTLTPRMLCAGYEHGGVDTCQGDSGGPLITNMGGKYTQVGLTSFGRGCGLPQKPGVYTKVSQFNRWIQSVMSQF